MDWIYCVDKFGNFYVDKHGAYFVMRYAGATWTLQPQDGTWTPTNISAFSS